MRNRIVCAPGSVFVSQDQQKNNEKKVIVSGVQENSYPLDQIQ